MDNKSKALGYLVGRQIAGMRRVTRLPVAYLYNGVRLPKLPEVDSEHLFLYICEKNGDFFFVAKKTDVSEVSIVITAGQVSGGDPLLYAVSGDVWQKQTTAKSGVYTAVWCGEDITDADGAVVLAASDPAPVYE